MTETIHDVQRFLTAAAKAVGLTTVPTLRSNKELGFDAYTVSTGEWPSIHTVEVDGYTSHPKEEGFEVTLTVPVGGGRDEPPDVDIREVGQFTRAVDAAEAVVKGLVAELIANALRDESEAAEREEIERQAKEVF